MLDFLRNVLDDFLVYFVDILLRLPAVIIAIAAHGFAGSLVARCFGDRTSKAYGRLSINPIKHIDPIGFLCLLLFRFGWASATPINTKNFRHPKLATFLSALAGPLANLLLAFLGCFLLVPFAIPSVIEFFNSEPALVWVYGILTSIIERFCLINTTIALFNLIPLPPLAGFRMLSIVIPKHSYKAVMKGEKYFALGFLIILLIDSYFFGYVGKGMKPFVDFILNDVFAKAVNIIFLPIFS